MSDKEQTDRFSHDLDALVERYRKEYDLSYASVIGVLLLQIHMLSDEACNLDED